MFLLDLSPSPVNPPTMPLPLSSLFRLALTLQLVRLAVIPVGAQVQAPSCLPAAMVNWNWVRGPSPVHKVTPDDLIIPWQTYNSFNQSPCQTAAYLAAECNNGRAFRPVMRASWEPR